MTKMVMKVRLQRYAEASGGRWSYSFAILPEIEFHWTRGRLRVIYIGWLIWDIVLDFDNKYV